MENKNQPPPIIHSTVVIVNNKKSVGLAFILAFLFGPLGLLYVSIVGGIIMFAVSFLSFFILPIIGYILVHIGCIIWAIVGAQNENKKTSQGITVNHHAK